MKVRIFADAARASRAVARLVARQLEVHPVSVLGLPTGRTSVAVYKELVRIGPDFSRARTFNLDEFVGLPAQNRRSFHAFMDRHLLCRVNIPAGHVHFLDGAAVDLDAECARFERAIAAAGGMDLLVLGIGANGHIGFNEPGTTLFARTAYTFLSRPYATSTSFADAAAPTWRTRAAVLLKRIRTGAFGRSSAL